MLISIFQCWCGFSSGCCMHSKPNFSPFSHMCSTVFAASSDDRWCTGAGATLLICTAMDFYFMLNNPMLCVCQEHHPPCTLSWQVAV